MSRQQHLGKCPSHPNYSIITHCHRSVTQANETGEDASWAGPGAILGEGCLPGRNLCGHAKPQALCGRSVQRCRPHFTVMETKAPSGQGHSCSSDSRQRTQVESGCLEEAMASGGQGCEEGGEGSIRQPRATILAMERPPFTEPLFCVGTCVINLSKMGPLSPFCRW